MISRVFFWYSLPLTTIYQNWFFYLFWISGPINSNQILQSSISHQNNLTKIFFLLVLRDHLFCSQMANYLAHHVAWHSTDHISLEKFILYKFLTINILYKMVLGQWWSLLAIYFFISSEYPTSVKIGTGR